METYTLREAAQLTGITVAALRRRADRGTIQTVQRDGRRRVPRSELERAGLRVGPPPESAELVAQLAQTIRDQERELAALRLLPARVEAERRRVEDLAADQAAAAAARDELQAQVDAIAAAGPIRALRLRRQLRSTSSEAAGDA